MGTVTAHGRDFSFDDNVSAAEQQTRINNWMQMHAPDELKSGAAAATPAATSETSTPSTPSSGGWKLPWNISGDKWKEAGRKTGDYWRTIAQGVVPGAEEGIAGIRSMLPGGADYDTNLADERMRLKRYGDEHGETVKMLTELGGGLATIPLTMGAGLAVQGAARIPQIASVLGAASKYSGLDNIAAIAAKYPKIAALLNNPVTRSSAVGAGTGAAYGFGAGEGQEDRVQNAKDMAFWGGILGPTAYGVTKGGQNLWNMFNKDNRVANYLRKALPQDRGEAYKTMPGMLDKSGNLNVSDPTVINRATDELSNDLARQRGLSQAGHGTDVIAADALPGTMETILQQPGSDTGNLARQVAKRQFDPTLPVNQQIDPSQHGQVKKWFDRMFGGDAFRDTEANTIARRSAAAEADFAPVYPRNTYSPEIEEAYNRAAKLRPDVIKQAELNAETARGGPRPTVNRNAQGDLMNYNMQHLHDVKRLLDQPLGPNVTFDKKPLMDVKNDLNKAMMASDSDYERAMLKYGDESQNLEYLERGRNEVFGKGKNELDKGIGDEDIKAVLNDPDVPDTAKQYYREGAARALRNKLLGSDASKFGSNWADVLENPNMMKKYEALVDPAQAGSWDTLVRQVRQLSDRQKAMNQALGNSRTATRLKKQEDLSGNSEILSNLVASSVNPTAPSGYRHWIQMALDKNMVARDTANRTAKILSGQGRVGNQDAVAQIRDILSRGQGLREAQQTTRNRMPFYANTVLGSPAGYRDKPLPEDQK